jgi:hypothetical protein
MGRGDKPRRDFPLLVLVSTLANGTARRGRGNIHGSKGAKWVASPLLAPLALLALLPASSWPSRQGRAPGESHGGHSMLRVDAPLRCDSPRSHLQKPETDAVEDALHETGRLADRKKGRRTWRKRYAEPSLQGLPLSLARASQSIEIPMRRIRRERQGWLDFYWAVEAN